MLVMKEKDEMKEESEVLSEGRKRHSCWPRRKGRNKRENHRI